MIFVRKPNIRGMLFRHPCHQALLILCVKGNPKGPKRLNGFQLTPELERQLHVYEWKNIACPQCGKTCTATLPRKPEPKWTHSELPDPFAEQEDALFQLSLEGVAKWMQAGKPDWKL